MYLHMYTCIIACMARTGRAIAERAKGGHHSGDPGNGPCSLPATFSVTLSGGTPLCPYGLPTVGS